MLRGNIRALIIYNRKEIPKSTISASRIKKLKKNKKQDNNNNKEQTRRKRRMSRLNRK